LPGVLFCAIPATGIHAFLCFADSRDGQTEGFASILPPVPYTKM
jgi:hypothetical protein